MTSVAISDGTLFARLAAVIADVLRVPADLVTSGASFAALGMDSLAAVEITAAIEDALGIELPMTAVHECPTLDALCAFVEHGAPSAATQRGDMLADAILPAEISPDASLAHAARTTRDARRVLLTGATGFVGAFLLRAIADETSAEVCCLVRATLTDARQRLRSRLGRYGLWSVELDARVHVIEGDVGLPRFGLSRRDFESLANDVDAIYHAAADVNWVSSYESLRTANVLGTIEVLRLACTSVPKPLHFLSSVSVCHSTLGSRHADENVDGLASIEGLWMGYAQSKCVAEALVREAGARGLPVTIVRPSLVTGDVGRGRTNPDDLVSRFIAGCIAMRAAPDLDWRMDCVPVDDVATSVLRLASAHESGAATAHLTAASPRHWRECVLWMKLSGYDIDLVPYREWIAMLGETSAENPLYVLRPFFMRAVASEDHLTLPELFEETRRVHVSNAQTQSALSALGHSSKPLSTRLLSRYFDDFERHALIAPSPSRPRRAGHDAPEEPSLAGVMRQLAVSVGDWLNDDSLRIESIRLRPVDTDESIVAELTAWRGGTRSGLYHADVIVAERRSHQTIRLFVKSKPADTDVIDVAQSVAALASPALGEMVDRFRDDLGFTRSHVREIALYADRDSRLRAHTPKVFAAMSDDATREWMVVLESVPELSRSGNSRDWSDSAIDAAITGLARVHAVGIDRFDELNAAAWQAPPRDRRRREEMLPLWSALATHAFERFPSWGDRQLRIAHDRAISALPKWSRVLDDSRQTLIHNDFNPRNIVVRQTDAGLALCAFDWELATIGLPQRDLAEFLAFVLPENAPRSTIARWIERHRSLLERETGVHLDTGEWEHGFSAALCDLLVDRLAFYAMVDRIRRQAFLPKVARAWTNLFHHYPFA